MKKLLITTFLIISLFVKPAIADEPPGQNSNEEVITEEVEIEEEVDVEIEEEQEEDRTTLSEQLEVRQENNITFLSVLVAIIAPSLFIAITYLLIKMTKE